MRWINRAVALAAVLALSAVSVWAQAKECNDEFKTATYSKWYDNRKDKQDVAYDAAKEYLAVCTDVTGDQYAAVLKKFVDDYDKINGLKQLATAFDAAVKAKNHAEVIRVGKQLSAIEKDNAALFIVMAGAGLSDASQLAESAQAAKKAIDLIEQGKPFTPFYQTKDNALAGMTYVIARNTAKTSPTDAIPVYVKALKFNSDLKKEPSVYNELATAYGEGPVAKYAKDYAGLVEAQKSVDSPEVKLVVANLNQALDRQIDAFARAAAASKTEADKQAFKKVLAEVYKDRTKKDAVEAELNSMVASVLSTPVPDAPTPITTVPATSGPAPVTGGMTNGTTAGSAAPGNGSSSSNASSSAAKPSTATGLPKPASSPSPKPRQR